MKWAQAILIGVSTLAVLALLGFIMGLPLNLMLVFVGILAVGMLFAGLANS